MLDFPVGHAYLWQNPDGLTLIDTSLPGPAPAIAQAIDDLGFGHGDPSDLSAAFRRFHAFFRDWRLRCRPQRRVQPAGVPEGLRAPAWVNHTGGHSLYAVAVTGAAVYVGGHQRRQDNPQGHKTKGLRAVDRPGIAALDPVTGRALGWNPTRGRGEGVRAFASTRRGLLVGSDTDRLGHEHHGRIGLFPHLPAGRTS